MPDELSFHPLSALFPLMGPWEFRALVEDIRENGLRQPIIAYDGKILDGRNRFRACEAAGVPFRLEQYEGTDPAGFVWSENWHRRHLTESQKAAIAAEVANMRQGARTDLPSAPGREVSQPQAAKTVGASERSTQRARVVKEADPALFEKVKSGEVTVKSAEKQVRQKQKTEKAAEAALTIPDASTRWRLMNCDLSGLLKEPAGSVDIVCTDPPYPAEFLPLFDTLGKVCAHLLKPGGLLLCMSGQTWLPAVMASLALRLDYHWTIAYLTPGGQATQVFPRKVNTFWKPVLVFSNGPFVGEWFGDVTRSNPNDNDKAHHHWGQSESGMADLMRRFVGPGMLVADPFLGGGTTGLVTLALGASFLGCDVDEEAIATTKARFADANLV